MADQRSEKQRMLAGELYRSWRGQEGIGMGDIKLMLMIGGFSGLPGLLFALAFGGASLFTIGLVFMSVAAVDYFMGSQQQFIDLPAALRQR